MATTSLLSCTHLRIGYGAPLLPQLDLEIERGEFWVVVGRNGSGKTAWFKTMLGLLPPVSGTVRRAVGVRLGYVAQRRAFDELYPVTVREVVSMGGLRRGSWLGMRRFEVEGALDAVGARSLEGRTFRSLSEGQKQRVLLARLIASEADVAFLDEPTAAMDAVAEAEAMALLDKLRAEHDMTVIVVSHHLDLARKRATRALFLDPDQEVVVAGAPEDVFSADAFLSRYHTTAVEAPP